MADNTNSIEMTQEEYEELLDELAYLEGVKAEEIKVSLQEARSFGDLSENAEFDAAREEQGKNAARIAEIRAQLGRAKIVEKKTDRPTEVSINTTAVLLDERGNQTSFTIVGSTKTNSLEHKISGDSPLGKALIGSRQGDEIEYSTPSGKVRRLTVVSIEPVEAKTKG